MRQLKVLVNWMQQVTIKLVTSVHALTSLQYSKTTITENKVRSHDRPKSCFNSSSTYDRTGSKVQSIKPGVLLQVHFDFD